MFLNKREFYLDEMANFFKQKRITRFLNKLSYFSLDKNLPHLELRKYRLTNVVVFSITFFLILFAIFNFIIGNKTLVIFDIAVILFISIPSIILQYKKCYNFNKLFVVLAFIIGVAVVAFFKYDVYRQSEYLLLGGSIIPIFLFDKWRKNLMFVLFPITFFAITFYFSFLEYDKIVLETSHLILALCFLMIFVLSSYFKQHMIHYYNSLAESNATKDKLFRIISHDIRNPFNSLLSSSELQLKFLRNREYEKLEKTSQIINTSANQIYELTQTLLDWSITQTSSFHVRTEMLNINDLVEQVVRFCSIQAREKDIEIITNYGNPVYVELDNVMTQIAVRNILINAIKFSYRNSVIKVYVRQFNDFVNIDIVDKGIGMSEQRQKEIFNKPVISSEYGTERERGTGLGIVISKELVEKQKGKISVESTEGKGSSFTLSFPLS